MRKDVLKFKVVVRESKKMIEKFPIESLIEPLLAWFEKNARTLPWRENVTPYRVWVSEIMLQQTRVEAVKPYFLRFMKELPSIPALAACEEEKLLKLWEGLGYYSRVRNMQTAAQTMVEKHHGEMPHSYEEILELKGIGTYTAGAIASISFGLPVPAVDGNVLRVLTRVSADFSDIAKQATKKKMETILKEVMPEGRCGAFNQALMELGATVCVPNGAPFCEKCPWQEVCEARKQDKISELPVKSKAKARRVEQRTVLLLRQGERVAVRKRPAKGLLAGLYEFPNMMGHLTQEEVIEETKRLGGMPIRVKRIRDAKHIFSHVEWQMWGYVVQVEEQEFLADSQKK
ncbi:MAG: A/G-specific adenine glycosylase, partial [Lachnospiraceae bacterium]